MFTKTQIGTLAEKITGAADQRDRVLTGSAKTLRTLFQLYADEFTAAQRLAKREKDPEFRTVLEAKAARSLVLYRLFYAAWFIKDNALGLLHPAVETELLEAIEAYHAALYLLHLNQLAEHAHN